MQYFGLESFYSLAGRAEFGSRLEHETYVRALAAASTNAVNDVMEYVLRDFYNVMVGNTDNHGRNSSVLKGVGWVRLAPLYDVAPMKFDPEGVVRNTRWGAASEEGTIAGIADFLQRDAGITMELFLERLSAFYLASASLVERMVGTGVPQAFIAGTEADRRTLRQEIKAFLDKHP